MSLDSLHPQYEKYQDDNELMRDSYAGQRTIKKMGVRYLPPTPGMVLDGMGPSQEGTSNYENYKQRAVYPDFVEVAVESLLGIMHTKPPIIELPPQLEDMRLSATVDGEGLEGLLRRINEDQLVYGRVGALLDLPTVPDPAKPLPFIVLYKSEAIRNWDSSEETAGNNTKRFIVLDESGFKRVGMFDWQSITRRRVLMLGNGDEGSTAYHYGLFEGSAMSFDATKMEPAMIRGTTLDAIPFEFINSKDNLSTPDDSPLLGLANAALTVYHGEADYRQALFLQGQDTLVVIGGAVRNDDEAGTRVGAGAKIECDIGGDAKYVGVSSTGLPELRSALENDYKRAEAKTGQLISTMTSEAESGEALKTRLKAQTATLHSVARTGAKAVELLLKAAARWVGADPDKVSVLPNLEFADMSMTGKDLLDFMTAKNMGAPISAETIHGNMKERGITKLTYEEEQQRIEDEAPILGSLAGGGNPIVNAPPEPPPTDKKKEPAEEEE